MVMKYTEKFGNVVFQNVVVSEYYSNSGATTTANGQNSAATTVVGSGGSSIISINSTTANATTDFIMTTLTPNLVDDIIILEVNNGAGWVPSENYFTYHAQSTSLYGMSAVISGPSQITVSFCNRGYRATNATYAGDGAAWSTVSAFKWRVRRDRVIQTVTGAGISATGPSLVAGYAEGTFVPGVTSSGGGTLTGGNRSGTWTRIGRKIFYTLLVQPGTLAGLSAGNISITGLPFASSSTANTFSGGVISSCDGVTFPANATLLNASQSPGTSSLALQFSYTTALATTNLTLSQISSGLTLVITGDYHI